jgi:hypothetical protein
MSDGASGVYRGDGIVVNFKVEFGASRWDVVVKGNVRGLVSVEIANSVDHRIEAYGAETLENKSLAALVRKQA